MSLRLSLWKIAVVAIVIMAFVGTGHIVWAGSKSSACEGNKGYIYVRHGEETVKAQKMLKEKEAKKKAHKVQKPKAPKMKWVNVYFATGNAEITSPDVFKLNRAARLLKINGQKKVLIIGSADMRGSAEANSALGLKRAKAVKNYLIDQGISADRLKVKSIGKSEASKKAVDEKMAKDRCAKFEILLSGLKKKK